MCFEREKVHFIIKFQYKIVFIRVRKQKKAKTHQITAVQQERRRA